jgi:hypothetical protein
MCLVVPIRLSVLQAQEIHLNMLINNSSTTTIRQQTTDSTNVDTSRATIRSSYMFTTDKHLSSTTTTTMNVPLRQTSSMSIATMRHYFTTLATIQRLITSTHTISTRDPTDTWMMSSTTLREIYSTSDSSEHGTTEYEIVDDSTKLANDLTTSNQFIHGTTMTLYPALSLTSESASTFEELESTTTIASIQTSSQFDELESTTTIASIQTSSQFDELESTTTIASIQTSSTPYQEPTNSLSTQEISSTVEQFDETTTVHVKTSMFTDDDNPMTSLSSEIPWNDTVSTSSNDLFDDETSSITLLATTATNLNLYSSTSFVVDNTSTINDSNPHRTMTIDNNASTTSLNDYLSTFTVVYDMITSTLETLTISDTHTSDPSTIDDNEFDTSSSSESSTNEMFDTPSSTTITRTHETSITSMSIVTTMTPLTSTMKPILTFQSAPSSSKIVSVISSQSARTNQVTSSTKRSVTSAMSSDFKTLPFTASNVSQSEASVNRRRYTTVTPESSSDRTSK